MKRVWKRWGALLLAVAMTLSLLPMAAFAAEGDTPENIAQGKTIHAYNKNGGSEDTAESNNPAANMVDGVADSTHRWAAAADMKTGQGTTATANDNPKTVIIDLGENKCATDVTQIKIVWHALVWAKHYTISTAADEYASNWRTVYTAPGREDSATNNAVTDEITELKTTTLQRFVKFYFEDINLSAGGSGISIQEIEIYGTLADQETVTQYVRQTGEIEPGIYLIHSSVDNGTNLHANSNATTTQCGTPDPIGDTLETGHVNDDAWPVTAHQWTITAVEGGYTIRSVSTAKYLSATPSGNNLSLLDNGTTFSITPAEGGYAVSYNGAALRFSTSPRGWNLSTDGGVVQLFKKTVTALNTLTITAADDGSRDVGANESGTYSNDPKVIHAWACSQQSGGPAINAVDGNTDTNWHSRWNGNQTDEENTDQNTTDQVGWGQGSMPASMERRWIELDLKENSGAAQWLSGLRYYGDGNGRVVACEIRVWDETAGAWAKVTSNTVWNIGNGTGWSYKEFDCPVQTSKVRLYGATTASASGTNANMSAREIRLVKALTETAPATQTVTVTVKDAENNPIDGATVNSATTDASGQATLTLMDGMAYTLTVAKEGYKTKTVKVQTDGADIAVEVTLRAPLDLVATDATYDYPLTDIMVSAVSQHDNDGSNSDGHANWAIDYENHWWHQFYNRSEDVWFAFSLPAQVAIAGIRYQQREESDGSFGNYEIQTSTDGTTWTTLADEVGTWGNDHVVHVHELEEPQTAQYFRVHRTTGNAQNRTAKLFQLVLAPEGRTTVSGTVTKNGSAMSDVTVRVYQGEGEGKVATYKTVTTNNNGGYSIVLPRDGQSWTLVTDSSGNKPASYTLTTSDAADTHNFELETRELHLTGTAPEGTTVQLMQGAGRTPVAGIAAQTGTSFDFDVSNLAAGTYYVRAWKDGCVPDWKAITWTATTESLDAVTVADSDLVAVDTSSAYKSYDFSNATQVSEFGSLYGDASGTAAHDSENGAMTLTFSGNGNGSMWANTVGSKDYVLKNGTISFDVTQTAGDVNGRFGLVFLQFNGDGEEAWAFIGEMDNASRYFAENARVGGGDSGYSGGADGPAMGVGVTRHFEVTVDGANLALKIDGLAVTNWNSNAATAGYWGFTQNKQNTSYRIDNLVVTRADAKNTVSWTAGDGETLTAAIVTPDTTTGTALTSGGNAFAGDTIKITGSKTGAILNAVTVNGSAEGVTKTAVEGGGYAYTFTMPAAAATVAGTFVDLIPEFTVSGADASGNISAGTVTESGFTGNTLAITGELASDNDAEIQWYKKTGDSEWTEISGATSSSYTLKQSDYNSTTTTTLKVKVTGNGTHHAGWKESGEFTVTALVYAVTSVTLQRDTLTMWTNHTPDTSGEFPAEVGDSATLTATVGPQNVTGAEITWTSDNESAVTVVKDATNPKMANLTAAGKGTANITVSVTAGGVTKTATCTVTVKTKVDSITVKNGTTAVTMDAPAKVYINDDGTADAPRFVTLVGTPNPADATDKGLVWSLAEGSATGKINIQPVGGSDDDPNSATSSGSGVTITAVPTSALNVGEVTVEVAANDGLGAKTTFKVQVRRKLASTVSIDVQGGGAPKFGKTLVANISSFGMSDTDKETLSYQWKRTKDGTTEDIGTAAVGAAGKSYTLTEADIGATISVVVTANSTDTYYDGSVTSAATAVVAKADAPATPTLSPTKPSEEGQSDGSITITNYNSEYTYQIKSGTGDWEDATVTTEGKIEGKAAGTYSVKIKETNTRKESAAATATIAEGDAVEYTITTTQPTEGATISVTDKATKDTEVTITLTVTEGWQVDAVKVNGSAANVTAGEGNTWTFTMPEEDVTVTAEVSKKQVTITLVLSNVTATCDAEGSHTGTDTHTVDYGTVETITLTPADGYDLPDEITVTGEDLDSDVWDYSSGKIMFTGGVTENITITVTADKKTYTVGLNATGGRLDLSGDENEVEHGATFSGTLSVKTANQAQYALPETLTSVTMGGTALTAGTGYTYNNSTGAISIPNVTGNVVITATAAEKKTQLTGVTIAILHNDDTGMGSSNQNVPHVGDTLTATAAPTGATVTYQWFVGDSTTAAGTSQTYTVKDGDTGTIKVVVTGTGAFEGTKEAVTAAVGEKTWRVTGVRLNKTTTSLVFGGEETLTATVEPSTATNKKVTWSSNNTSVATVDANGKVTATGKGTAIITVTTEDGEQTATCAVTVTAAALPALQITKPQVDKTASVSFAGGVSTSVATYEWYTGESDDAENGTWNRVSDVSGASWLVTGVPSGRYIKVIAHAKSTGNYTGSSTVVSAAILSNDTEVEKYGITVNTTGDGTVTVKVNDTEATEAAEGDGVTVEVTGVVTGATVEVASTTDGVTLEKGAGNTWTFTMPAEEVAITVTITEPVVEKYAITVSGAENGTVTANKTEAAEGQTVTLTVTPADGYKLDTLTVSGDSGAVTVTDNTFVMPAEAVTVTATFVEDTTPVDTSALEAAITAAQKLHDSVEVAESAEEVPNNKQFVTDEAEKTALADAIATAQEALEAENKTAESIADAVEALNAAVAEFEDACQWGTKATSNPPVIVLPSKDPEVTENDDGSKTTTETKPDGTVIETTEKPDGTVEVVETKKDGTVTETTTQPDGTKEVVETKPDGTVTETTEKPDGSSVAVETKPDGTVTEIKTDADGAKVEKVTDPEEGVTITATDADGETVAEMKIPTVMPELETRFEDVPVGHWADKAIHQLAAVEVVEGVGDNKYDMASPMNRGALATVLHRLANKPAGSEVSFEDVLDGKYYTEGVAWAAKVGVVKGFSAEEFKPEETITREQLALMLMRYAKLLGMDTSADATEVAKFADGKNTHAWALDGIAWCVKAEIIRGRTDGTLAPTDNVTRAEVAVMIDRFIALMK